MAIDTRGLPFAKPEPRSREKSRRDRREAAVKEAVRKAVMSRDGHCRLMAAPPGLFGACRGRQTWNHLRRRSQTRGMAPEDRHSEEASIANCERHHEMIDHYEIGWDYLTERGAGGPMEFRYRRAVWREHVG